MSECRRSRGDSLIEDLQAHALDIIQKNTNASPHLADQASHRVAEYIWREWGGHEIYILKDRTMASRTGHIPKSERLINGLETHARAVIRNTIQTTDQSARRVAFQISQRMWNTWGGLQIYIPKIRPALEKRDEEIFDAFQGANIEQLVRHYSLSAPRIYAIVKKVRARRNTRRHPQLFGTQSPRT